MAEKNFLLGDMVDDLVEMSLELCGKGEDRCPRFPRWSYSNLVDRIMNTALDIQELVIEMNEYKIAVSYQGWRQHAWKGNTRNMILKMDEYLNGLLEPLGYRMRMQYRGWDKKKKRKKWRVVIEPLPEGEKKHE